ncbi:mitotic spindle assembly checkpoint protein MAD1 [Ixodes scapularis]|uniref:mitotic spindle assembly checkpoint protein MAD1 n=1 Tax=Ixodes scapularis TaxID=6945 RepID=UPI001A9E33C3|nr:mitotic spindle assembly checkpoint protein MAD1 [Ixodes scapularis]
MQYSGHCREYEKRLHYRNCELLKLKQQLANVQQAVQERGILVEKEVESDEKLRQVEQKLQEKDTEVQELRRKLDTVQSAYKKELAQEKNHSKDIQKQLHALSAEHEMLQKKVSSKQHSPQTFFFKNANSESQNFDKGIGSFLTNLDREKKERLLAKLREIDLSGTIFEGNIRRPQAARRFSMDSQRSNFTVKSPDLEPKQTLYQRRMFGSEGHSTQLPTSFADNWRATRRMSDIHPRIAGSVLDSIFEKDSLSTEQGHGAENASRNGCQKLQKTLTATFGTRADVFETETYVFTKEEEPSRDLEPARLLPWER